jgi:hypothetical protein
MRRVIPEWKCRESRWIGVDIVMSYELAIWCKLLRDRGWSGPRIATAVGRSEGYVNNLIRIIERASLCVLERWRLENQSGHAVAHACSTDWLAQVCMLPHPAQDEALAQRVERLPQRHREGPTE